MGRDCASKLIFCELSNLNCWNNVLDSCIFDPMISEYANVDMHFNVNNDISPTKKTRAQNLFAGVATNLVITTINVYTS